MNEHIPNMTPYRPSNGTEAMIFYEEFCDRCVKDDGVTPFGEPGSCDVRAAAFLYDVDDQEYPRDTWVVFNGKPTCLGYRDSDGGDPEGGYGPVFTDPDQIDMFEELPVVEAMP